MRFMKRPIIVLLLLYLPSVCAEDYNAYLLLDSFSYGEPMAVAAIASNKWDEKLHKGDTAFSTDRIEAGIGWKQWQFGVFRRYDYYYEFSPDTALLKQRTENNLSLTPGQQLDIYLSANTLDAKGLSLAYKHTFNNFTFGAKASYLVGNTLTSGQLDGKAEIIAENDYDLNFDVDYYYSEDKLFDRQVTAPEGEGYALDIFVDWQIESWDFNLEVKDLFAKVYWRNAPRTIATGNTDTKDFDEDGFVVFNPVISGLETNQDYTQTLPRKIHFKSAYALENYSLLFELYDYDIKRFYSAGAGISINADEQINVFYNVTAEAMKFYYRNQWLMFSVTSDDIQFNKARTLGLELSVVVAI